MAISNDSVRLALDGSCRRKYPLRIGRTTYSWQEFAHSEPGFCGRTRLIQSIRNPLQEAVGKASRTLWPTFMLVAGDLGSL
jgi:hypothetical protein